MQCMQQQAAGSSIQHPGRQAVQEQPPGTPSRRGTPPRPATLGLLDREAETLHTHQHRPVCGTGRDPGSLARI
eukprot:COSAG01_NODE_13140_length_1629_cov_2.043137_4_plen_72_part_01